jgi:quercetin dioxygenase-like cupin family protein
MIFRNADSIPVEMKPGLTRRTLVSSNTMMICEFSFDSNVEIPMHAHPHEQVGYIAKGRVRMTIEKESYELKAGDSYYAPSNVPHGAFTLEPAVIVDTFSPPREDYLK